MSVRPGANVLQDVVEPLIHPGRPQLRAAFVVRVLRHVYQCVHFRP